jgi:acyl-CoA thioesterase-1
VVRCVGIIGATVDITLENIGTDMTTLVCLGDSITQGHIGYAYAELLQARFPAVRIINAGIDGDTTLNLWHRLERDVLVHAPDIVTIMVGLNDFGTEFGEPLSQAYYRLLKKVPIRIGIATYATLYRAIVERLQRAGCRVVLLTPTTLGELPDTAGQAILDGYADVVRQLAHVYALPLADVRAAFVHEMRQHPRVGREYHLWMVPYDQWRIRYLGNSYARIAEQRGQRLLVDGVHLNLAGATLVAEVVAPVIQTLLEGTHP